MSQQALVPCPKCQNIVPIEFRHAGQDRTCPSCKHIFVAPKLRELKLLSPEDSVNTSRGTANVKGKSNTLQNLMFVLGLGTALLAGVGAYLLSQYTKSTLVFDEKNIKSYALKAEGNMDDKNPAQLWDEWDTILESRTLPAWELMGTDQIKRYSTTLQWATRILAGLTILGLLCLFSSFLIGKTPRTT